MAQNVQPLPWDRGGDFCNRKLVDELLFSYHPRGAVLVKLLGDLPPHVGDDGRDGQEPEAHSQSQRPREGNLDLSVVELQPRSSFVGDEEN